MISRNLPHARIKQQRCRWKNRENYIEKGKRHYEEHKERFRKLSCDQYKRLSEEETNRKENMQNIGTVICLKKTNRKWKDVEKVTEKLCLKKINIKETIHKQILGKIQKELIQQCVEENKNKTMRWKMLKCM